MSPNTKALRDCVVLTVVTGLFFLAFPGVDVWFSALFFAEEGGFWLAKLHSVNLLRELIWTLIVAVGLGCLAALVFGKLFRTTTPVLNKVWEVAVLTYLLGPALLVDALLKAYWGRARPSTTTDFGGVLEFTPPFILSDQCPKNCSFVSGEGAGVTALLIAVLLVTRNMAPRKYTQIVQGTAFAVAAMGLSLRVLMGRHFLSDTLFAILFVTMIALALLQLKRYRSLRLF